MLLNRRKMALGMIICLFGVTIACILMELFQLNQTITIFTMAVGAVLLFKIKSNISQRLLKKLSPVIFYLLIALVYGVVSGYSFISDYSPVVYVLYSLAIATIIMMHTCKEYDSELFISFGWWISGLLSIVLLPLLTNNFSNFTTIVRLAQGSDRLTIASIATAYLIFFLVYKPKKKSEAFFSWVVLAVALIDILLCNVRRVLIAYALVMGIHFFKTINFRYKSGIRRHITVIFKTILFVGVLVIVLSRIEFVTTLYVKITGGVRTVILGYLGREDGIYNSGAIRNANIISMWTEYTTQFSTIEVLFGKGYMYKHIDFPYFQAFTDMGIFVGMLYVFVQLVLPTKYILETPNNNGQRFLQYFIATTVLSNFFSGTPYGYDKFIPIIFLIFVSYCLKEKQVSE